MTGVPLNCDFIDEFKETLPPTLVHVIFGIGCPSMKQASLTVCCTRRTLLRVGIVIVILRAPGR